MWLLLYPEGTNMSPTTIEKAQTYAKKVGGPHLKYTLLPKATGMRFCLQNLQDSVDYVYDCTIAYEPMGNTGFAAQLYTLKTLFVVIHVAVFSNVGSLLEGMPPKAVHMHWRRFAVRDIPIEDEAEFTAWYVNRIKRDR